MYVFILFYKLYHHAKGNCPLWIIPLVPVTFGQTWCLRSSFQLLVPKYFQPLYSLIFTLAKQPETNCLIFYFKLSFAYTLHSPSSPGQQLSF